MIHLRAISMLLLLGAAGTAGAQEAAPPPAPGLLRGRHRIELGFGYAEKGGASVDSVAGRVNNHVGADNISVALGYSYWFRPELAVSLRVTQLNSAVESVAWRGERNEVRDVFSVLFGLRRDFLGAEAPRVRPYLTAGLGPYVGSSILNESGPRGVTNANRTTTAFGGQVGGGVDVRINRRLMLGLRADYDLMSDFSSPVGGRTNYSGLEAGVSLSFLFGKGTDSRTEPARPDAADARTILPPAF